jgi:hypothetical protein
MLLLRMRAVARSIPEALYRGRGIVAIMRLPWVENRLGRLMTG